MEGAAKRQKDRDRGQVSMFDLFADDADSGFQEDVPAPDGVEWPKRQLLTYEKEIMKIYVSDHPLTPYEKMCIRDRMWGVPCETPLNRRTAGSPLRSSTVQAVA